MSDIISVLNAIGYTQFVDMGTEWRTNPLYREYRSLNNLSINKKTGKWFDHSEREGGTLAQLVQKTLQLPTIEETKAYLGDLPITIEVSRDSVELTEIKKFDKGLLVKLLRDNSYWHNRGISDRVLEIFRGGVAQNGRMKGRYVFPIFDDRDDLIGFSGRLIQPSDSLPKWKHIGQKKNFIFPFRATEHILQTKTVMIVESIGDCLKLMECGVHNSLVSFGVSLSPRIIQHLLRLDVSRIVIALNNDEDNGFVGNLAAQEYKEELARFFDEDQLAIALPTAKDFGEMSCEAITEWKNKYLSST
jgi:DNA primase